MEQAQALPTAPFVRGAAPAGTGKRKRSADNTGRSGHYRPVLETDQFRVIEPDGTEDPWANADDGVVPEQPATPPDTEGTEGAGVPEPGGPDKGGPDKGC